MRRTTKLSGLLLAALVGALVPATDGSAQGTDTPEVFRFDGGGYDQAAALAVDAAGNAYLGGSVEGGGDVTFAVVKLSRSGTVLWTGFYNGSRGGVDGSALAVAVDPAGNVYAAGSISDGGFYPNLDYLVVAFGPDGRQRWAQRYNGPGDDFDRATEIAVDAGGAVYVSGTSYTPSPDFSFDWSTHKYSAGGELLWERRHAGADTVADKVAGMVLAPNGNVVVTGTTRDAVNTWATDIATVTYNSDGDLVWQVRWTDSATSNDLPRDMGVDAAGRITVTGTVGDFLERSAVTLRYGSSGALLQTIRGDGGGSVDVDDAGNFYLAGFLPGSSAGSLVARYDASGTRTWASPATVASDEGFSPIFVRADSNGAVTVAGTATNVYNHNSDYLVIRLAPTGRELWRYRFNGPISGNDRVAGLAIDGTDAAVVTGTSWNGYLSSRNATADDIVTLRFAAGAVPPLLAPTDLAATGISGSQIRLSWTDRAGTEDGFRIERCRGIGCGDFAPIASVGHDVTTYIDEGLARNTKYSYRVRAFNAGGVSAYSNIASGKTRQS